MGIEEEVLADKPVAYWPLRYGAAPGDWYTLTIDTPRWTFLLPRSLLPYFEAVTEHTRTWFTRYQVGDTHDTDLASWVWTCDDTDPVHFRHNRVLLHISIPPRTVA